jgi:hypothetical protein
MGAVQCGGVYTNPHYDLTETRATSFDFRQPMSMKPAIMLMRCLVPILALNQFASSHPEASRAQTQHN